MINYYFPPIKAIGSIRNFSLAQGFSRYFKHLSIISTRNARFLPQEHFPASEDFDLHQVKTLDLRRILSLFSPKNLLSRRKNPGGRLTQFLLKLKHGFPFSIMLNDGGPVYLFLAYQLGEALDPTGEHPVYLLFLPTLCGSSGGMAAEKKVPTPGLDRRFS